MAQRKPNRIAFFGSSTIHGYGDPECGGFVQRFRLWYEGQSPKNFVYQLGVFGETTANLTARIRTESAPRRPHLIVLYPGFNDMRREGGPTESSSVSLESYREQIIELVKVASELAPTLVMTGFPFDESRTTPYKGSNTFYLASDAERYTEVVRQVCNERKVPVLDYFALWSSLDKGQLLAPDGLHANSNGHQLLFEQLCNCYKNIYSIG